ncbi:MAG: DUF892 family protein [Balneolaceae bacterium]|nr:DUF892 family protein [Balneolaceae bacterium]
MKSITTKNELYMEFLKDIYSAKVHEISVLLFFKKNTSSQALADLIHNHTGEVRMQVLRLEELIEFHDETISTDHCRSMKSMVSETKELVKQMQHRRGEKYGDYRLGQSYQTMCAACLRHACRNGWLTEPPQRAGDT